MTLLQKYAKSKPKPPKAPHRPPTRRTATRTRRRDPCAGSCERDHVPNSWGCPRRWVAGGRLVAQATAAPLEALTISPLTDRSLPLGGAALSRLLLFCVGASGENMHTRNTPNLTDTTATFSSLVYVSRMRARNRDHTVLSGMRRLPSANRFTKVCHPPTGLRG